MKSLQYKVLLIIALFSLSFFTTEFAQVNVSLPKYTKQAGAADEYINLTVGTLTQSDNVTSFGFDIYYNPNVVFLDTVTTAGSNFSNISNGFFVFNPYYASGDLRVGCITSSPITGSGTLVRIKVHYLNPGQTNLSFVNPNTSQNSFKFNNGSPAVVTSDGNISIVTAIPTITLTAPNGGENWQALSTHNITWTSSNISNVKLEYSLNNGTSWATIVSSTAASSGSYGWALPDTNSTQALVRISDASNSTVGDSSNAVFTISPVPKVNVISPNGGENWLGGSIHNITWSYVNVTNVKIEYSTNNGVLWTSITNSTPANFGSYSWTLPNISTGQALVRISDSSNPLTADTSNAVFTITAVPKIIVTSPNGGESWLGNSIHNITWTSQNVANVKIELSLDNGGHWSTLANSVAASSAQYSWTVPDTSSSQALIRISDASNPATADTSNAVFTISKLPTLHVTSPNGGENWEAGTTHNITWSAVNVTNIKIEYSSDNGSTWNIITSSIAASLGTYSWTIPNISSASSLVRITSLTDSTVKDVSDGTFVISLIPKITVTSPNGGETWQGKTSHNITWTFQNVSKVKIEYTLNNGTTWIKIADSVSASSLSYTWIIPDTSSSNAKVRITDDSNTSLGDTSDAVFTIMESPKIHVVSPNGAENWVGKSTHNITWTSVNVSNVKIEYSLDNGVTWLLITSSTAASSGSYSWVIPDTSSNQALVRISDASNSGTYDVSNANFSLSFLPKLVLTSPNGGEVWQGKTTQRITWFSVAVSNVKIQYSLNNAATWNTIIDSTSAASGGYNWVIPDTVSNDALVKITSLSDTSLYDASNNVFSISNAPKIIITSPNGGENWLGNSIHNITWNSVNVGNVKIEFSLDNGASWKTIVPVIPSSYGYYSWNVPDTLSAQSLIRISDASNAGVYDVSNAVFTVSYAPKIVVVSPNGGEVWQGNSIHNITWTSISVSSVKIEYSLDNGTSWTTIVSTTPSTGIYNWTVPDTASAQARIRISDAATGNAFDISDAAFTIEFYPAITVTSPNGTENWLAKSVHDITWTSVNVTNVKIDYSLNNGTTWLNIVPNIPASTGKYSWTVPDTSSSMTKIRISDASNSSITDMSDFTFTISPVTGIDDGTTNQPSVFKLDQNYPNPFNPVTNITYSVPERSYVILTVYNILGKEVASLVNGMKSAGSYSVQFNGVNLESGVYFYRMQAGNYIATKKLILIK